MKQIWRAWVQNHFHGSHNASRYTIHAFLEQDPDRAIHVLIEDPVLARHVSRSLLDWAEKYEINYGK